MLYSDSMKRLDQQKDLRTTGTNTVSKKISFKQDVHRCEGVLVPKQLPYQPVEYWLFLRLAPQCKGCFMVRSYHGNLDSDL